MLYDSLVTTLDVKIENLILVYVYIYSSTRWTVIYLYRCAATLKEKKGMMCYALTFCVLLFLGLMIYSNVHTIESVC